MKIEYREDMYQSKKGYPQCCFFETFPSSPDPHENFYGTFFCHLIRKEKYAELCKGDYLKCPLAYGKINSFSCPDCGYQIQIEEFFNIK